MSPALLEETRRGGEQDPRQAPLFDDLRRALPGSPPGWLDPDPDPGSPGPATARGERDPRSGGDRLSLEAHLERIWEGLLAVGAAECPVCAGPLQPRENHAACRTCGSTLS
ncbi:MAG: hypothetical protein WKF33_12680 [Thermoleophilaceae bacterium]|nr:hypothetical protein [Actinomycetota bacterium]